MLILTSAEINTTSRQMKKVPTLSREHRMINDRHPRITCQSVSLPLAEAVKLLDGVEASHSEIHREELSPMKCGAVRRLEDCAKTGQPTILTNIVPLGDLLQQPGP
jgi:hypothetical protein